MTIGLKSHCRHLSLLNLKKLHYISKKTIPLNNVALPPFQNITTEEEENAIYRISYETHYIREP